MNHWKTLDPQVRAFLESTASAPSVHQLNVRDARKSGTSFVNLQRDVPAEVDVEHRFIGGPTADLPVRIYRPRERTGDGVILMLHGSGWVICNLDVADRPARQLAVDTGLSVVTVNYQKAPEHPYPVPLDDCFATLEWVASCASELGVDAARIALIGDSAGGNLAAALAIRAGSAGISIAAQALLYPALNYDFSTSSYEAFGEFGISRADMQWFWATTSILIFAMAVTRQTRGSRRFVRPT